ncbi:MAG: large conductance mechanosensitive channel protein MscL [Candidatus Ornithomonoglobus sp.]
MKFIGEFKEFIAKGNVVDMAVGIVVGGAFTSIVNSLVGDIITPAIALITKLFQKGTEAVAGEVGAEDAADKLLNMSNWIIPGTEINIGNFIQSIISFLILAFVIFCIVKGINTMRAKVEKTKEEAAAPAEKPADIKLLEEIRDALVKERK